MERFKRTEILIGNKNMNLLKDAHVLVVGVGGVGGYVCEMLARSGIGKLTIVDFDVVSLSNINRQIIALSSTVGKTKVSVMEKRILDINPNCKVVAINEKFSQENVNKIFSMECSYIVDAIDDISNKVLLAKEAKERNIKIISAMGAGNRIDLPNFKVCDVYKTFNDGLAKKFRKALKEAEIESLDVAFSEEKPLVCKERTIGSTSYVPSMCGCTIAGYVINKLIKNN